MFWSSGGMEGEKIGLGYFLKKLFQRLISQTILLVCSVEFVEPPFL